MSAKVIVRPYSGPPDDPYIYATWTKNVWYSIPIPRNLNKGSWFKDKIAAIKEALTTHEVRVACLDDDPDTIVGYSLIAHGAVAWVYVKELYRDPSITRLLTQTLEGETDAEREGREDAPGPGEDRPADRSRHSSEPG